jgi:hypothetical protein
MKQAYWSFNLVLGVVFHLFVALLVIGLLTMGTLGTVVAALILALADLPLLLLTVYLVRKIRNPELEGKGPFSGLERPNSRRITAFVLAVILLPLGVWMLVEGERMGPFLILLALGLFLVAFGIIEG